MVYIKLGDCYNLPYCQIKVTAKYSGYTVCHSFISFLYSLAVDPTHPTPLTPPIQPLIYAGLQ